MSNNSSKTSDEQVLDPINALVETEESDESPENVSIVFPENNRVQIANTTTFPYCTVGRLRMEFPNGKFYSGTGTLIHREWVLTCAHNLYNNAKGGWAKNATFSAAQNGDTYPNGQVAAAKFFVPEEYRYLSPPDPDEVVPGEVDYTKYVYDYALVKLDTAVVVGVMKPHIATNQDLENKTFNITGYPGDKTKGTMWSADRALGGHAEEFIFHKISTYNGQSGSAVSTLYNNLESPTIPRICGIHVAGSQRLGSNFAVRITKDVIKQLGVWMES